MQLLSIWNRRVRLTGESDTLSVIRKHVADSLAVVPLLPDEGPILDLGSGAGFPGIVIACARPALDVILIEARRRRASFLKEVVRSLPLAAATVVEARAEDVADTFGQRGKVVIVRGLRLDATVRLGLPLLSSRATLIAMQTPGTAAGAAGLARRFGLQLRPGREYRLPGGERRVLLLFERSPEVS